MTHFQKLGEGADVSALLAQLNAHPELWDTITMREGYANSPHKEVHDIWVRYNDFAFFEPRDPQRFSDPHVPIWYPAWDVLTELQPFVRQLVFATDADMIGGILITRLPPGGKILPHKDSGWHVDYFDKFYITVQNGPGGQFACEHDGQSEAIEPVAGDLYRFDNRVLHWVNNNSAVDRITVIVCLRTAQFTGGKYGV